MRGRWGSGGRRGTGRTLAVDAATGEVRVSQENGAEVVFTNAGGVVKAAPRVQATLTKNADGTYTFVRQASQTLTFSAGGVLALMADRNGETTTLSCSGGRLASVTGPAGRKLTVTFTGTHITGAADPITGATRVRHLSASWVKPCRLGSGNRFGYGE